MPRVIPCYAHIFTDKRSTCLWIMAAASSHPSGYRWMYLPWELDLDTYRDTFYSRLLPLVKPEWRAEDLDYYVFESGVTNTLVAFYQKHLGLQNSGRDVILLRVDGVGTEKIINRTDEVITRLFLHDQGFCPPLYAQLKNGQCYGFCPGRRLKVHETSSNSAIMSRIAGVMANLHVLETPSHFKDREPFLWLKIGEFMQSVPTSFSDRAMQNAFVASVGTIENLRREIKATKDLILRDCQSAIVFCHNDIHSANLIYDEETDSIKVVDYEYAGPNYSAYDIANHFCEFAGVEEVDYRRYPDEVVQKRWIRRYLEEMQKLKGDSKSLPVRDDTVHRLYCEVNKLALGCHLLWVAWALFQAANSTLNFDFMEYASLRYAEYMRRKEEFSKLQ